MSFSWLLWCMALPCCFVMRSVTCCPFPDFLQSGGGGVEWLGEASEGGNFTSTVTFHGRTMRSMETGSGVENLEEEEEEEDDEWSGRRAFQRECLIEVTAGRFLCSHRHLHDDYENRYVCMEFIIRSKVLIQLRESSIIRFQDPRLCSSDQLRLNDRPLINRDGFFVTSHPCPSAVTGGYNVRLHDRRHGHGVCDAFEGTTRIEAQCSSSSEEDQGLVFRFRFPQCVPGGLRMDTKQRTFCVVSWTDDEDTYVVIRHDGSSERAWCLRYHTRSANTGAFTAHLFTGLRCNRDPVPVGSIVLDMRRDLTPPVQRSLCADDYEACLWENPCRDHWPDMQLACARRCGVCNDTMPRLCTLPAWIRGRWLEMDLNETLEVGEGDMTLSGERYQCVDWQGGVGGRREGGAQEVSEPRGRHGAHSADVMFIKTSSNGCRHRYVCAQWRLVHRSMVLLLKYRFSRTQVWPFDGVKPFSPIGCHLFEYDNVSDSFLGRHLKTLVQADTAAVDCRFPSVDEVTVTLSDLTRCKGHLRAFDDRGVVKMRLVLVACPGSWRLREFRCVGDTSHSDETFVVTYLEQTSEYHCWIFSSTLSTDFYLLSMSDCAAEAFDNARSGLLQPVMSFHSESSQLESSRPTLIQTEIDSINGIESQVTICDKTTDITSNTLPADETENVKTDLWQTSATQTHVEKVPHNVVTPSLSTPTAARDEEFFNNQSSINATYYIENVTDNTENTTDENENTGNDSGNTIIDDIGNSTNNSRPTLKSDDFEAYEAEKERRKVEIDNVDYRRGERSRAELDNDMNAEETNDTSREEDIVSKEMELDAATIETKLDYEDEELNGKRQQTPSPTDIEAFRRLNKSLRSKDNNSFDSTNLGNRHSSSDDDVDDDDSEGSSYQQTDDIDVDDIAMTTVLFHRDDDIDVIDDSNQLSTPGLSQTMTDADDENVTSVSHQLNDVTGYSSNDVNVASTTIVSLKPMAVKSSASSKTSTYRSFFNAISLVCAFLSWNLASTVSA